MTGTQNGKSILLAENERSVRTLLLNTLREAGYKVLDAADGREGLEKSRQFNGTIHLLLADVEMPNMTGIELATQIQIDRPGVPVLLMSGMESGMLLLNDGWQFLSNGKIRSTASTCSALRMGPFTRWLEFSRAWKRPFRRRMWKRSVSTIWKRPNGMLPASPPNRRPKLTLLKRCARSTNPSFARNPEADTRKGTPK